MRPDVMHELAKQCATTMDQVRFLERWLSLNQILSTVFLCPSMQLNLTKYC